jgi:hypothetical protein
MFGFSLQHYFECVIPNFFECHYIYIIRITTKDNNILFMCYSKILDLLHFVIIGRIWNILKNRNELFKYIVNIMNISGIHIHTIKTLR